MPPKNIIVTKYEYHECFYQEAYTSLTKHETSRTLIWHILFVGFKLNIHPLADVISTKKIYCITEKIRLSMKHNCLPHSSMSSIVKYTSIIMHYHDLREQIQVGSNLMIYHWMWILQVISFWHTLNSGQLFEDRLFCLLAPQSVLSENWQLNIAKL